MTQKVEAAPDTGKPRWDIQMDIQEILMFGDILGTPGPGPYHISHTWS